MISIIPNPVKLIPTNDEFYLSSKMGINPLTPLTQKFQDLIEQKFKLKLTIVDEIEENPGINITINPNLDLPSDESYALVIDQKGINLEGKTEKGVFYGIQTLRQLIISEGEQIKFPCITIEDYPKFSYRGFMFDVGRHYHLVETIKKILDILSLLKMNVFHWHLTEDQGWRIEIKRYPKLTEIGSKRKDSKIGSHRSKKYRGIPHEGYYSQEEIKEVVQYAKERYITIIPEIELPGHSSAAIASYPKLSCTGKQIEVKTGGGIFSNIYCAGKESTFEFLQYVFDEVIDLFPSEIIHIGGDEAPKKNWKSCPDCTARIQEEGLNDVKDLQVYFTNRIGEYLKLKNRRLMGWNQILGDSLDPSAVAQWWALGKKKVYQHLRMGRDFVISKVMRTYLDYGYFTHPLKKFYNYNPIPKKLESEFHKNVIGVEAPLWTEWVPNLERFGWQVFPRLIATAEVAWTPLEQKNYSDFKRRLIGFMRFIEKEGIPHAPLDIVDPNIIKRLINFRKWLKWPEV